MILEIIGREIVSDTSGNKPGDMLGLEHLGRIIDEATPDRCGIERIADAYRSVMTYYAALQDRYQLLKASNKLLSEELAWLRDQCDDFAVEQTELVEKLALRSRDTRPARPRRRLEDRR
jgi:hypothetical protein